ncbi:RNB domain-containing ribonuclease [Cellulomonas fimi]|uniref:RNB domain-containing ribonuclease n=1 Tax=Cellulomonas fimi TaxID=1708 RepID=A0A7Y0QJP0_CELFI|nr:RNB domain-containing ribonuclease [Cellulomonas fimi]NMR21557.1 RNB domain-containing ribonuclease [Cellulomonas fimi]
MIRRRLTVAPDGETLRAGFVAIRAELAVPEEFDPVALAEAAAAAASGPDDVRLGEADRADLRHLELVTVDPPGSTDLDQAVHLERTAHGYRVRYAIADVAAFVAPGGALDAAAHARAETVYCPDRRIPLHPPVLSEGSASLLAGQDRPAVVWTIELDADGAVTSTDVRRALVRSRAQLAYPEVQRDLDAARGDDDGFPTLLAEIGALRRAAELARGGVSLGRAEQEVVPDGDGWDVRFRTGLAVEEHNAQISLLTGMAAARLMLEGRIGVLRTMPPAEPESLAQLRRQAHALGVPWEDDDSYGDVLARVDHARPETAAFLAAATRLFRGAAWTTFDGVPPDILEHSAVAAPYAHVTAPLRRLVDRYGLEVCLAVSSGRAVPEWVRAALPSLGRDMAAGAQRSGAVDRECTALVEAAVLAPHVGRVFEAVAITRETVQLEDPAVVAPCDGPLPEGDPLRVRLVTADVARREVRFTRA